MVEKSIHIVNGGGGGVAVALFLMLLLLLIVILLACRPWRFCSRSSHSPSRFRPSIKVYLSPHSPQTYTYASKLRGTSWRMVKFIRQSVLRSHSCVRLREKVRRGEEDDVERPLVSEDLDLVQNQRTEVSRKYVLAGAFPQSLRSFLSPRGHGLAYKQRLQPTAPQLTHSIQLFPFPPLINGSA
ncbi:hypothetical protein LguiA_001583 [Lonicera macranthoides]